VEHNIYPAARVHHIVTVLDIAERNTYLSSNVWWNKIEVSPTGEGIVMYHRVHLGAFSHQTLRKVAANEPTRTGYQYPPSNERGSWCGSRLRGIDHRMLLKSTA
jgi:hypothetical protein